MNKLAVLLLVMTAFLLTDCKKTPTQPQTILWNAQKVWPRGTHPVPNPAGDAVLFVQEEPPAGLYLLQNGTAIQVNPDGPAVRADYAWSSDGTRFCFSAPGLPGSANAGIYLANLSSPTNLVRLWDRGSHPRFLQGTEGIICAGPEDSTAGSGIWQLSLTPNTPLQLLTFGVSPEISPDGGKIAFLMNGSDTARTLVVVNRETASRTALGSKVVSHSWLSDSQSLVFETLPSGVPVIATVQISGGQPNILASGSDPAAFPDGNNFVFTGVVGDRLDGLYTASLGTGPVRISQSGAMPRPAGSNSVYAQDSTGIVVFSH